MDQGSARKSILWQSSLKIICQQKEVKYRHSVFSPLPFIINILLYFALENVFQKSLSHCVHMSDKNVFRLWVVVDVISMAKPLS